MDKEFFTLCDAEWLDDFEETEKAVNSVIDAMSVLEKKVTFHKKSTIFVLYFC